MMQPSRYIPLLAMLFLTGVTALQAEEQKAQATQSVQQQGAAPQPVQQSERAREFVFGYELMTPQERREMRLKMRTAKSVEEREQLRQENHERMMKRAQERGVQLMEAGMPCWGMGPGAGMGPGPGRGGPR